MRFLDLIEDENLVLYHGDDYGTTTLDPKWMIHDESNNQEGVGIYFTPNIDDARGYGPKISSLTLTPYQQQHLVDSRSLTSDHINPEMGLKLLMTIHQNDEDFWYAVSDYSYGAVTEPEDVDEHHLADMFHIMSTQEIRNFQSELATHSSGPVLIAAWNAIVPIIGMWEEKTQYYSIINTKLVATPVNF